MPGREDDVFAPGPSVPMKCCGNHICRHCYINWADSKGPSDASCIYSSSSSTQQSSLCKQGGRSWPIHGNGDDALPIDPALAATTAALGAITMTDEQNGIRSPKNNAGGTGSRSTNPFGRPCLFKFPLCRQHFSTHRRT
ncbi:hypothetical protein NU195Hw_g6463t1 [Hortaea werneckii]